MILRRNLAAPINVHPTSDSKMSRQIQLLVDHQRDVLDQFNVFKSNWLKINAGQRIPIAHDLGRIPDYVQLVFGSDGINVDGDCTLQKNGLVDSGCSIQSKNDKQIVVQAGADNVGFTVDATGHMTPLIQGYVRVTAG